MATTAGAIRDVMLAAVEAKTPTVESGTPFLAFREQVDFREWAAQHPDACLRRVSIRNLGSQEPAAVTNTLTEETSDTFEVIVAYPSNHRFGGKARTSLDDAIEADQIAIHATIGPPGYASLAAAATVLHQESWSRETAGSATLAVITYRVDYYRSLA